MLGSFVVVRTYSAGVHCGYLKQSHGTAVILTESRNIWQWDGANTCNELALHGASEIYTRISEPVSEVLLTEAIAIYPCTPTAEANLKRSRWGN